MTTLIETIIRAFEQRLDLPRKSMSTQLRRVDYAVPRHCLIYFLRTTIGLSYREIGAHTGGRHHSTIIHSCDVIEAEYNYNPRIIPLLVMLADIYRTAAADVYQLTTTNLRATLEKNIISNTDYNSSSDAAAVRPRSELAAVS